jgi:hypothetical protein
MLRARRFDVQSHNSINSINSLVNVIRETITEFGRRQLEELSLARRQRRVYRAAFQ